MLVSSVKKNKSYFWVICAYMKFDFLQRRKHQLLSHAPFIRYLFCDFQIDQILVHQTVELLEGMTNLPIKVLICWLFAHLCSALYLYSNPAITGFETNNKYEIKNSLGQLMYRAEESNDCCTRNCLGSLREFDMMVTDGMEREVIRLVRPCRCDACCFPCCLQEVCTLVGSRSVYFNGHVVYRSVLLPRPVLYQMCLLLTAINPLRFFHLWLKKCFTWELHCAPWGHWKGVIHTRLEAGQCPAIGLYL